MVFASGWGLAVGGCAMRHQVPSTQHSMQHSVIRTLYSIERRPHLPPCQFVTVPTCLPRERLAWRVYFQIHSKAEGSVAATALPSTWPAFRQKTYW